MAEYRAYDHRIKSLITRKSISIPETQHPLTTAITWINKGVRDGDNYDRLSRDSVPVYLEPKGC